MKKSLLIIITPTSSQPRFHKRIEGLSNLSDIIVFSFNRGFYEVNNFKEGIKVHDLGQLKDRKYLERIVPIFKAVKILRNNIPHNIIDIKFYTFSIDCLLIAKLAGIKIGFLEVGDLILMNTNKKWFKVIEKLVLRFINGLVLTSKEYYNQYYKYLGNNPVKSFHYIENKVPKVLLPHRVQESKKTLEKSQLV